VAIAGTGRDDRAGLLTLRLRGQRDVEESRTGNVDRLDAVGLPEPGGDQFGDLARWPAGRLGQLQGCIGRVVTVVPVLRPPARQRSRQRESPPQPHQQDRPESLSKAIG
jgi:hypothetical protein